MGSKLVEPQWSLPQSWWDFAWDFAVGKRVAFTLRTMPFTPFAKSDPTQAPWTPSPLWTPLPTSDYGPDMIIVYLTAYQPLPRARLY